MTIVSSESKFDKVLRGETQFSELEAFGSELVFNTEEGDCFHCHGSILATDNLFHNNGLDIDANLAPGRFDVTENDEDFGKFKTPSLRNLVFTAPYMHDGRFETLQDVVHFYSELDQTPALGHREETLQPLALTEDETNDLIEFLKSLTGKPLDPSLLSKPSSL